MKQNLHKNITQTNQETSKLAPYNCTDTENSSFVGDHLQSEETNKSNDYMHNQIKEAEILCSPACSDQYQRYCFIKRIA